MIRVVLAGVTGWVGRALLPAIVASDDLRLVAAVSRKAAGRDAGEAAGGEDGQIGENWVRRNDGTMDRLKGADATVVDAGEAIIIQTPTAGGYGKP